MNIVELRAECYRLIGIKPLNRIHLLLPITKEKVNRRSLCGSPLGLVVETWKDKHVVSFECWNLYCWTFLHEKSLKDKALPAEIHYPAQKIEIRKPQYTGHNSLR